MQSHARACVSISACVALFCSKYATLWNGLGLTKEKGYPVIIIDEANLLYAWKDKYPDSLQVGSRVIGDKWGEEALQAMLKSGGAQELVAAWDCVQSCRNHWFEQRKCLCSWTRHSAGQRMLMILRDVWNAAEITLLQGLAWLERPCLALVVVPEPPKQKPLRKKGCCPV